MYKIFAPIKVDKQLSKLARQDAKKVSQAILKLTNPFRKDLDIKKITGQKDFYRLRIGKVRAIFEVDKEKKEVWIRKVGYRASVYRLLGV